MSTIGERIKEVAFQRSVTLKKFSELVEVPYSTLQTYIRGTRDPSAAFLATIMEKAGVNPLWILSGEGEPFYTSLPSKGAIDKIIVSCLPEILEYVAKNEDGLFNQAEQLEVISYINTLDEGGVRRAMEALRSEPLGDLPKHIEFLKEAARAHQAENIERLKAR